MSQKTRILTWLEERGEKGVHSFELYQARMPRGAAAVCDLRKEGHAIESVRETYQGEAEGVRYVLRSDELIAKPPPSRGPSQSSPYDPYSDFS